MRFFNLLAIYSEILPKICLFSENGRYLTTDNWPYARACARARAHRYLGQYRSNRSEIFRSVLLCKNKGLDKGNKNFFCEIRSRALVQRMVKMMPKYEKCQKSS